VELFHDDCDSGSEDGESDTEQNEECVMAVKSTPNSSQVVKGRETIRFRGFIRKQELSILQDSGKSGTFINETVAQGCKSQLKPCAELQFVAADGLPMVSNHHFWFSVVHLGTVLLLRCESVTTKML
jgi:hypothetical protein